MKNSRTGPTNRAGIAGVVVAALGLLLGLAFVAPAGAQDGGDSYTTASPSGDSNDVGADSTVNPDTGGTAGPADVGADSTAAPSTTGGTTGTPGGTPGAPAPGGTTGAPAPGGTTGAGAPGVSSPPLARTGFGATLPSLLATALVAGGAMLVITVAKRRRNAAS